MQLRHHRGPLNTVPYGNIRRLVNESRDWVIEKLEFRVTYDTDIVKVRKILKRIGQEILADPELAAGLLEPLKSQGITAADDSARGIRFAHRQVTVFTPPGSERPDGPSAAARAAAAAAAEPPPSPP
jgi:small-conductance mechanosensitive channel